MSDIHNQQLDLATEKVSVLLRRYSIPAIISMLAYALYNIVDRIFIGQGAGAMAISGLTLTFPILSIFQAFATLVAIGAATRISIVLGQKDLPWAERILGNSIILTIVISTVTIICGLLFLKPILRAFGGSEQTIPYAAEFLYITLPACFFGNINFTCTAMMRASGYPRKSMAISLMGVGINIILAPIFIFGFGMGIRGAASATAISMIVSSLVSLHHFVSRKSLVNFKWSAFRLRKRIVRNILTIGLSPFLINAAASLVNAILNKQLYANGGDLAVGAFGIISSFSMLAVMVVLGVCQGMQPIVGYSFGAKKLKRMKDTLRLALRSSTIITSSVFVFAMIIPHFMVSLFTTDDTLTDIATIGLRTVMISMPLVGAQITLTNFFQSIGKASLSIFMSLMRQLIFLVPALLLLGNIFGLTGVWFASPVADVLSFIVSVTIFLWQVKKFYPRKRIKQKIK